MPIGLEPLGGFSRHTANRLKPRVQVAGGDFQGRCYMRPAPHQGQRKWTSQLAAVRGKPRRPYF
ncbi:MAG: hypothetical protein N2204_06920, partial [Anaerolineae bacterium]|nr:hypothetical protein [Anaerolineae bacterium]